MKFQDAAKISGTRITPEGYLVAEAFVARAGVQLYNGEELGRPELGVVAVYRSEDEVRAPAAMMTFSHKPITIGHPAVLVDQENWKDFAKGEISTEATWDGDRIKLPLIVKDAEAVGMIRDGLRGLSAGYMSDIAWGDGVTPNGESYQARQTNIRINHVALVNMGRAGEEFRIGDAADAWGAAPLPPQPKEQEMTTKTVVVGDKEITVAAEHAPILEAAVADHRAALDSQTKAHEAAIQLKDTEIGGLKAKLATAEKAVLTDEQLRARVRDRAALENVAKKVDPKIDLSLGDNDLKKAVVVSTYGADSLAGASPDEVAGAYRIVAASAAKMKDGDPFKDAAGSASTQHNDADPWASFDQTKKGA